MKATLMHILLEIYRRDESSLHEFMKANQLDDITALLIR